MAAQLFIFYPESPAHRAVNAESEKQKLLLYLVDFRKLIPGPQYETIDKA